MSLAITTATPAVRGADLRRVSAGRWRVLDRTGRVMGHVRAEEQSSGTRYHAERFDLAGARFRHLGAFWSAREAVECLRYLT